MAKETSKTLKIANVLFTLTSSTLSMVNSLAFTNKWLDVIPRGILIISLAVVNIFIRCVQCCVNREKHGEIAENLQDVHNDSEKAGRITVLFFVALSTFSDCTFDLFQGIILMNGIQYDNEVDLFLIIGTWIGFGEQIFDFIEDVIELVSEECESGTIVQYLISFTLYISILAEQSFGIYLAVNGLGDYPRLLIVTNGMHMTLLIVLFCAPFFIYGHKNIGFEIMPIAFSAINAFIFTFKVIEDPKIRAMFVMAMALLNIIFMLIQNCCCIKDHGKKVIPALMIDLNKFSDPTFDIIQAIILFVGITYGYEVHLFVIIGTCLGMGQQVMQLIMKIPLDCCDAETSSKKYAILAIIMFYISLMVAMAAQSICIYIMTLLPFGDIPTLSITTYTISGIVIFFSCCCCCSPLILLLCGQGGGIEVADDSFGKNTSVN